MELEENQFTEEEISEAMKKITVWSYYNVESSIHISWLNLRNRMIPHNSPSNYYGEDGDKPHAEKRLITISQPKFLRQIRKNAKDKTLDDYGKRKPLYRQESERYILEVRTMVGDTFKYCVELFDKQKIVNSAYMRGFSVHQKEAYSFLIRFIGYVS